MSPVELRNQISETDELMSPLFGGLKLFRRNSKVSIFILAKNRNNLTFKDLRNLLENNMSNDFAAYSGFNTCGSHEDLSRYRDEIDPNTIWAKISNGNYQLFAGLASNKVVSVIEFTRDATILDFLSLIDSRASILERSIMQLSISSSASTGTNVPEINDFIWDKIGIGLGTTNIIDWGEEFKKDLLETALLASNPPLENGSKFVGIKFVRHPNVVPYREGYYIKVKNPVWAFYVRPFSQDYSFYSVAENLTICVTKKNIYISSPDSITSWNEHLKIIKSLYQKYYGSFKLEGCMVKEVISHIDPKKTLSVDNYIDQFASSVELNYDFLEELLLKYSSTADLYNNLTDNYYTRRTHNDSQGIHTKGILLESNYLNSVIDTPLVEINTYKSSFKTSQIVILEDDSVVNQKNIKDNYSIEEVWVPLIHNELGILGHSKCFNVSIVKQRAILKLLVGWPVSHNPLVAGSGTPVVNDSIKGVFGRVYVHSAGALMSNHSVDPVKALIEYHVLSAMVNFKPFWDYLSMLTEDTVSLVSVPSGENSRNSYRNSKESSLDFLSNVISYNVQRSFNHTVKSRMILHMATGALPGATFYSPQDLSYFNNSQDFENFTSPVSCLVKTPETKYALYIDIVNHITHGKDGLLESLDKIFRKSRQFTKIKAAVQSSVCVYVSSIMIGATKDRIPTASLERFVEDIRCQTSYTTVRSFIENVEMHQSNSVKNVRTFLETLGGFGKLSTGQLHCSIVTGIQYNLSANSSIWLNALGTLKAKIKSYVSVDGSIVSTSKIETTRAGILPYFNQETMRARKVKKPVGLDTSFYDKEKSILPSVIYLLREKANENS